MTVQLNRDNFWDTNLSDIESIFLPKGSKITDYDTYLDGAVPEQGSVLLNKVINSDRFIKTPTFIQKIQSVLFKK